MKKEEKKPSTIMYVTRDEGKFALYWYDDDRTSIYLSNFKVKRRMRRRGIGTSLLRYIESLAIILGFENIFLKTSMLSYQYDFYRKRGYEYEVSDGYDEVWMRKCLQ